MWCGERIRWLGHPAFLAVVGVLVLNDLVLKGAFGAWWTGKLSDVAGVAMVAVMAGVVVGRWPGIVATATAFVALKTVPGVAEMVAPVLGGVTRRDPTDLVALAALVPMGLLYREPASGDGRRPAAGGALRGAAAVVGAMVAVLATTATSCGGDPGVTRVAVRDDVVLVAAGYGDRYTEWARSEDGGVTWQPTSAPEGLPLVPLREPGVPAENPGPTEACTPSACFRLRDGRVIQRVDPDGAVTGEVVVEDDETMRDGCGGFDRSGVLASIGATRGGAVVASLGRSGVIVRGPDGQWTRRAVLGIPTYHRSRADLIAVLVAFAFAPLASLALVLARERLPSYLLGIAVVRVGAFTALAVYLGVWASQADHDAYALHLQVPATAAVLAAFAALGGGPRPHPRTVRMSPEREEAGRRAPRLRSRVLSPCRSASPRRTPGRRARRR